MAKILMHAGDWLLGKFLPKVEAGACVPENGLKCYCDCQSHYLYRYNCYGHCYHNGSCNCT
jgi:hypothetical protein